MPLRSSIAVVFVAALTGVGLARVAGAVAPALSETPTMASAPAAPVSAVPSAPLGGHDDNEPDDPHGGDNPYDDAPPPRAGIPHISVPAQDGMLRLPGGRFVLPRTPVGERASRAVSMPQFWIDRTEVTVSAYRTCVDAHACSRPARASATCTYDADDGELPVSCVHWRDADAYCRFAGKRLPTELEWEYAARGPLSVTFPWGGLSSCSNAVTLINDQSAKGCSARPAHVGSHPGGASLFGVQDMSGNVEEWTADWYSESLAPGPAPRAGAAHVLRGGGWLSPPSLSRTTARDWGSAVEAGPNVGFRCARDD